jgi:peptidoglycan/LPS O-acetylase OafA/YrhL
MSVSTARYLPHIDGIRAIAVVSVFLFHLGVAGFPGGFVGVDIFFVISGFLITRLIVEEIGATGSFSFRRFYIRRLRRLGPAMLAMILGCFVAAYFLFSPEHLEQFGGSVIASLLSVSNIFFWFESGYFDTASSVKPLLHTWSLSVEEQFYLTWPLILVGSTALLGLHRVVIVVAAVGLISFAANVWVQFGGGNFTDIQSAMFYLPFFRVFELALGAGLVWLWPYRPANVAANDGLTLVGLAMIAGSIFGFSKDTPFPTYYALLPCVGTALLILCADRSRLRFLLQNRISVWLGLISYSLYLVHWPLIVFWSYGSKLAWVDQVGIFVAALPIATLMYLYIEQPLRKADAGTRLGRTAPFAAACAVLALILALPAGHAWANAGWLWRLDKSVAALLDINNLSAGPPSAGPGCFLGKDELPSAVDPDCYRIKDNGLKNVMLVGDSTASGLYVGLNAAIGDQVNLYRWGGSLCAPLVGLRVKPRPNCHETNEVFFRKIIRENKYDLIIMKSLAGKAIFERLFPATRALLEESRTDYLVLGRGLEFKGSLRTIVARHGVESGLDQAVARELAHGCRNELGIDVVVGRDHFLSLKTPMCDGGRPAYRQGDYLYYLDAVHVTKTASVLLANHIASWMRERGILVSEVSTQ